MRESLLLSFSPRPRHLSRPDLLSLLLFSLQFVNKNAPLSYVAKSFGLENWKKLKEIKTRLDPTNVFRFSLGGGIGTEADDGAEFASKGKGKAASS